MRWHFEHANRQMHIVKQINEVDQVVKHTNIPSPRPAAGFVSLYYFVFPVQVVQNQCFLLFDDRFSSGSSKSQTTSYCMSAWISIQTKHETDNSKRPTQFAAIRNKVKKEREKTNQDCCSNRHNLQALIWLDQNHQPLIGKSYPGEAPSHQPLHQITPRN